MPTWFGWSFKKQYFDTYFACFTNISIQTLPKNPTKIIKSPHEAQNTQTLTKPNKKKKPTKPHNKNLKTNHPKYLYEYKTLNLITWVGIALNL